MKTHELADMLANVVLLLRRMPDVECKQFLRPVPDSQNGERPALEHVTANPSSFTRDELEKKKKEELRALAKRLNVRFSSSTLKGDLIASILAKSVNGCSEQRAFLDML